MIYRIGFAKVFDIQPFQIPDYICTNCGATAPHTRWNTRPIEAKLEAECDALDETIDLTKAAHEADRKRLEEAESVLGDLLDQIDAAIIESSDHLGDSVTKARAYFADKEES